MKNKWKVAFFTLLSLLLIGIIALLIVLLTPAKDDALPKVNEKIDGSELTVHVTKQDFQNLANQFISDATEGTSMPTKMYVDDDITLVSKVGVLGINLPVTMSFDPSVDAHGNLQLIQTNIAVGSLDLPEETALKLVKNSNKLPDFITIQPTKKQAYINLNAIDVPISNRSSAHLKAEKLDLVNDDIELSVILPSK